MPRKARAIAVVALLVLSTSCTWDQDRRRPDRYVLPPGYLGWVSVKYNVPDAPPLPVEDGYDLYVIPPDGHLETSSHPESGWATDEFLDQRADGTRTPLAVTTWGGGGRIWARQTLTISDHRSGEDEERTHMFFVGTEDQYECYLEAVGMKPARKVDWPLGAPIGPVPEHCR